MTIDITFPIAGQANDVSKLQQQLAEAATLPQPLKSKAYCVATWDTTALRNIYPIDPFFLVMQEAKGFSYNPTTRYIEKDPSVEGIFLVSKMGLSLYNSAGKGPIATPSALLIGPSLNNLYFLQNFLDFIVLKFPLGPLYLGCCGGYVCNTLNVFTRATVVSTSFLQSASLQAFGAFQLS
jgi:hypothetical protein